MSDPIERYLDELRGRTPRRCRSRLVAEVREHLLDDAARLREQGLDPLSAEERAVARIGGPSVFAEATRSRRLHVAAVALAFGAGCGIAGYLFAEHNRGVGATGIVAATPPCESWRVAGYVQIDPATGRIIGAECVVMVHASWSDPIRYGIDPRFLGPSRVTQRVR